MKQRVGLAAGLLALVATAVFGMASAASASPTVAQATYPKTFNIKQQFKAQSLATARLVRTTNYAPSPAGAITKASANANNLRVPIDRAIPKSGVNASQPTDYATVKSLSITNGSGQIKAKTGLTGYDQETYGGYALEPPDSEICAGNGYIIQVVNSLVGVWDQSGHELSPPMAMEYFLSDFSNNLTDPKCYWDPDTKHFFLTILGYPNTFDGSFINIAVSQTGNPLGGWNIYTMDTTDPFGNANCPCLADQPLLGADKWTIQISTNEFPGMAASTAPGTSSSTRRRSRSVFRPRTPLGRTWPRFRRLTARARPTAPEPRAGIRCSRPSHRTATTTCTSTERRSR